MDKLNVQISNLKKAVDYVIHRISRFKSISSLSKSQGKMDDYGINRAIYRYFKEILNEKYKRDSMPEFQILSALNDNDVFEETGEILRKLSILRQGLDNEFTVKQFNEFIVKSLRDILNEE